MISKRNQNGNGSSNGHAQRRKQPFRGYVIHREWGRVRVYRPCESDDGGRTYEVRIPDENRTNGTGDHINDRRIHRNVPECDLRPYDLSDWPDKEQADAARLMHGGGDGGVERAFQYVKFHRGLQILLGGDQAVMMAFLVNWQQHHGCQEEFYVTDGTLQSQGGFEIRKAYRLLQRLKARGLIAVKVKRLHDTNRRHVQIDHVKLAHDMREAVRQWDAKHAGPDYFQPSEGSGMPLPDNDQTPAELYDEEDDDPDWDDDDPDWARG